MQGLSKFSLRESRDPANEYRRISRRESPVAQLVEQVAVNHPVAGSSPAGGALLQRAVPSA